MLNIWYLQTTIFRNNKGNIFEIVLKSGMIEWIVFEIIWKIGITKLIAFVTVKF